MEPTPKSFRLHIGLFGRTNVGKSTFLNLLAGQEAAIASAIPGTTTDPVEKTMELRQAGPVVFTDTAGVDDASALGEARRKKTFAALRRADVVVLLAEAGQWGAPEEALVHQAAESGKSLILVVTKTDQHTPDAAFIEKLKTLAPAVIVSSAAPEAAESIRAAFEQAVEQTRKQGMVDAAPELLGGILPAGGLAVLIVPIDQEAPKGRLILPQVQTIRAALDGRAATLVVGPDEYPAMLARLQRPPELVVCDSQVVDRMVADTPDGIPCTTFSILFARLKGDLVEMARAARALDTLQDGDKVLIAEACTHHPVEDDIGREKIPRLLRNYTQKALVMDVTAGRDWPENLADYKVVLHCGGCMFNRMEMIARMRAARALGVPVSNYGIAISHMKGVLARVLSPFPAALAAWQGD